MSYNTKDLPNEAKSRYSIKLKAINLSTCPYDLPGDVWIDDPTKWPSLEYPEVYTYLIDTPGIFTRESMKNRKSLEAHNQFISGWVRTVFHFNVPNTSFVVMKADVMPSQRLNDKPHTPWVSIHQSSANVINAHCSCMAGLGESCSHIGALLFKIEAAVRAGFTKKACTEEACQWNNDFKEKIKPAEINNICFYAKSSVDRYKDSTEKRTDWAFPGATSLPSIENQENFLTKLSTLNPKPVALHAFSNFADLFVPKYTPPERAKLPKPLRELYSPENLDKNQNDMELLVETTFKNMKLSTATIDYIMQKTSLQSQSPLWHEIRCGRITASNIHAAIHTNIDNPAKSIIKMFCNASSSSTLYVPALRWGIDHEQEAIDEQSLEYSLVHEDFEVSKVGFRLHVDFPFIGASPDGIFKCKCHNEKRLIEVKCPFSKRHTKSFEETIMDKTFFIGADKKLKKNHKYFTQIQYQLFVFDISICELIVWTPNWKFTELIMKD